MFAGLEKFARDLLTEDDAGTTWCPVRVFGSGLIGTHIGSEVWATIHTGAFDAVAFGTGSAALIAAVGAAIGMKSKLGADRVTQAKGE